MSFKNPVSLTNIKEIRRFGIIALFFFGCLTSIGIWQEKILPSTFFGVLSFFGVLFFLFPSLMAPIYHGWLKVGHAIGRFVTIIFLALAYIFIITPFAMAKRIISGRPLPLTPDDKAKSYWRERDQPMQTGERFFKRY
ncbi:hypothetical protein QUF70_07985 [Desulfobacterales bacterium HSG17]|nr:hypothetical protein [Desulfobacterales bacterium HSG17]